MPIIITRRNMLLATTLATTIPLASPLFADVGGEDEGVSGDTAAGTTQTGLPPAPDLKVTTLNPMPAYRNEPSIAINANNPQQIVVAFQIGPRVAYSDDGGLTWTIKDGTVAPGYKFGADVSVTYDNQGRAFIAHIAFDKLGTSNYWAHNATKHGIYIRRSLDGGREWITQPETIVEHLSGTEMPFEDKPYIVSDTTTSRFSGNLYVGWTRFTLAKSIILFSRSIDAGITWSLPIQISTQEGLPRDETGAVEGFTGAVGADGTLYVAWSRGEQLFFTKSVDGGITFGESRAIIDTTASFFELAAVDRANGFPTLAIDLRSDALFVTWSDFRNGDLDVFVSRSDDRGDHWSKPVRVNDDPIHNGADQFFPWIAIDRVDHSVNVIFYDRRVDQNNQKCGVTLGRSENFGNTFVNYDFTKSVFQPKGDFLGDYIAVCAHDGHVYGAWTRTPTAEELKALPEAATNSKVNVLVDVGAAYFHP